MATIQKPLQIPELDIRPEPTGSIEITSTMQQTLSLLAAFWKNKRVLVKGSPSGTLFVCSPQIKGIINVVATSGSFPYQGSNIPCSEVLVLAHPDNAGRIWVKPFEAAAVDGGYPLDKSDAIGFGMTNLNMLRLFIVTSGEKAIIIYSE